MLGLSTAMRADGGLRRLLIGKDGRFSTSQTQAAVWTVAIGFAVSYLLLRGAFTPPGQPPVDLGKALGQLDDVYLLLGFPYAALVAARGLAASKVDSGSLQKLSSDEARLRDLVTDDDGKTRSSTPSSCCSTWSPSCTSPWSSPTAPPRSRRCPTGWSR